jgi:glycosyltransferase involved in cell wall biosynthesis
MARSAPGSRVSQVLPAVADPQRPARVILLAYHFPPTSEVGALRAQKIAESFVRRGAHVHVITVELPGSASTPDTEGITVHRVRPHLDLRGLYRRFTRRGRAEPPATGSGAKEETWRPPERNSFIKRHVSAAMWLPDDHQGWVMPAARRACELAVGGCDLLYSTSPPPSVHLAGLLTRWRARIPWVAEFRDPWTDNPGKPSFVRSRWSDAAERFLERRCLSSASGVVTVTESAAERFRTRLREQSASKVIVVRNGIDHLDPPFEPRTTVERVIYVGSLYKDRDPRPFLRAVSQLARSGRLSSAFTVELIGDCRSLLGVSIEAFVQTEGLDGIVRFTDTIPHSEALARLRDADLLLLLAQHQPLQVPNKLYEYLGARRPILAFADAEGETARMLRDLGGHSVIDHDDEPLILSVVEAAIAGKAENPASIRRESILQDWTSERQLRHLHSELDRLLI